jgi:methionine-rich copper-binding protein CopC
VLIVRSYNSKSVEAISVTPDPSVNDIEVNVQLKQSSYVVIKVTNKEGNEIMRRSVQGDNGDNKYALTGTSKLQAGDYTLEIIVNSNERMTLHLIKS